MTDYANELVKKLGMYGYVPTDIAWVGTSEFKIPISEFIATALGTTYNAGYGRPETPGDVMIVMKDGSWFKRYEYDGSECWVYEVPPIEPAVTLHIHARTFNYKDAGIAPDNWAPALYEYCIKRGN